MNNTKNISCCICRKYIKPILILENIKTGWDIVRCPYCALTFVHPQPPLETISSYYNGMYSNLATEYSSQKMQWARNSVNGYSLVLKKLKSNLSSILDLGGGLGYYSKAFEELGYSVTLVEQDPVSAKFARDVLKIKSLVEANNETFFKNNQRKYDVVFLRHVIEHSINPNSLISGISDCLTDKGILVIETDNNAGIELLFKPGAFIFYHKLYKESFKPSSLVSLAMKRPFAVDPPRHLYGFRTSNLSMLLRQNSLVPLKTVFYRLGHPIYWPNESSPKLTQILVDASQLRFKVVAAHLLDILLIPIRLLLEPMGMASGICIYAQKE